ncbi:MAG: ribose 5-phosphate isomerase B [Chloroflexota bacterium]
MKIAIASDHAGFKYKSALIQHLQSQGHTMQDFGTDLDQSCDYPDFIKPAAAAVANGRAEVGIVLGGSGNGEAIAANKVTGIRCAVCWNIDSAVLAKQHNNANMISIGERMVTKKQAIQMVEAWLQAEFEGGRHTNRINKIEKEY